MPKSFEPVQPSTQLQAFSCPHCGALTTQHWRKLLVDYPEKDRVPLRIREPEEAKKALTKTLTDPEAKARMVNWVDRVSAGLPFVGDKYERPVRYLNNGDISECYNCGKVAIWIGDQMIWPHANEAPVPNVDLPEDVASDYIEAGDIVNASPRGAAALLRLALQKLCRYLGEGGKNINDDIKSLVAKGLDPRVQQMLDIVRVVGNNAVHPGEMNLKDDRETAERLFSLINMIADVMISQKKAIDELYGRLGERALKAIEKRDEP